MTNLRRVLLASAALAAAVPALPAQTAAADPIVECSTTFVVGAVLCKADQVETAVREDPPVIKCSVSFLIGPVQCRAENAIRSLPDL